MATTWPTTNEDERVLDRAVDAVRAIELAARVLRALAIVAAVVWLVGVIAAAWTAWDTSLTMSQLGGFGPNTSDEGSFERVRYTVTTVVSATWGYALVAVVALAGWLFAESRRAVVFLDALDEIDDTDGESFAVPDDQADA
jgi:hypothetical protein